MVDKQTLSEEIARVLLKIAGRYQSKQEEAAKLVELVDFSRFCKCQPPQSTPPEPDWYGF